MADENARDRREMLLQAVVDGDADSINPRDYTEKLLAEAAEGEETRSNAREHADLFINEIIGGTPAPAIDVISLSATENTTYTAPSGKAYSPVTVNVPNPNSTVTVQGTIGAPFGTLVYADLVQGLIDNAITITMSFSSRTLYGYRLRNNIINFDSCVFTSGTSISDALDFSYNNGAVRHLYVYNGTEGYVTPTGEEPCTITIIHHPLPTV